MYIFHRFPSREAADRFAAHIERSLGRTAQVYVYVGRPSDRDDEPESVLCDAAAQYDGAYAGT